MSPQAKANLRVVGFWIGTPTVLFTVVAMFVGRSKDLDAVQRQTDSNTVRLDRNAPRLDRVERGIDVLVRWGCELPEHVNDSYCKAIRP